MKKLIEGYNTFFKKYFSAQKNNVYETLQHGQDPRTVFLACCDSRVDPTTLTSAKPGDLFVVRSIANHVPDYETNQHARSAALAAIEFAVCHMNIEVVIVLGHQDCAGVRAFAMGSAQTLVAQPPHSWVVAEKTLQQETTSYTKEQASAFEKKHLSLVVHNMFSYPFIKSRVQSKSLHVAGWYFDLRTGAIEEYSVDQQRFTKLA